MMTISLQTISIILRIIQPDRYFHLSDKEALREADSNQKLIFKIS
jgi:hypothetical protein